jgi:hypothetical protein
MKQRSETETLLVVTSKLQRSNKCNKSQKMHEGKTKGDGAIHDHQKHEKHHVY